MSFLCYAKLAPLSRSRKAGVSDMVLMDATPQNRLTIACTEEWYDARGEKHVTVHTAEAT